MAGAFGVSTKRFGFVAMVLLLALFAFGSFAANDASAKGKKSKKAKVTISIVTKSQSNLLSSRKLKIKVKSTGKTKVSLSAAGNGKSNYFKKKKIKFKKNKKQTKTIKLVLNQNGVTALKKCGAPKIKVIGKYKKGKKKATAKKNKKLKKDSNRCITPVKPTCNPLDTKVCMQPWPNNFYTKSSDTNTGLQLDVPLDAMPKNTANAPIDLPDINRADGFSPGNLITTKIPAVETPAAFTNSGIVGATNMDAYDDPDQAVVVFDAATGERQPIYAELDANPTTLPVQALTPGEPPVDITGGYPNDNPTNTGDVNLLIRAAKNYKPGHRYIVVFRNLKDASNKAVEAAKPFKSCLDDAVVTDPGLLYTCNQLDDKVFSSLSKGDISRKNLYLAFDFTVASQENTTGRVLTIRNDAFSRLGDTDLADRKIQGTSPTVDVIAYCDQSDTGGAGCGNSDSKAPVPDSDVQRTVRGFIRNAPCYLNVDGCPSGSEFAFDSNGQLTWNPAYTVDIPFRCLIPKSVVASGTVVPGGTGS